ncbi:TauD/TfdA dioxygenase family protein [Nocardia sp. NPDC088792]|uniref:TauD/TfdA dioxygenase family protein n=1 Tax=Nocardia sp. NPDC088792 TaxID=3364332 RepID=UPI00382AD271
MSTSVANLQVEAVTPTLGAIIHDIDLSQPLGSDTVKAVRQSLLDNGVVFFRGQDISREQLRSFVDNFGTVAPVPFAKGDRPDGITEADLQGAKRGTSVWHADLTFNAEPPSITVLRAVKPPIVGGDTCWGSMYAAYETLSKPLQDLLEGLTAMHSARSVVTRMSDVEKKSADYSAPADSFQHVHPAIVVHPETGRKLLFVNESSTTHFIELKKSESDRLLGLLFEHIKSPDFTMRWHWKANDIAMWDNRSVQHYAVPDYESARIMQRVVVTGEKPQGPQ